MTVAIAIGAGVYATAKNRIYHFKVVRTGQLYRSGQLKPEVLERVIKEYGIKTVVNVQPETINRHPWHAQEAEACERGGARLVDLPMQPEVAPTKEVLARWRALTKDPERLPLLVHCQHGVVRTGMLVAVYRMDQGEPRWEVLRDVPTFGHRLHKPRHSAMWKFLNEYKPAPR